MCAAVHELQTHRLHGIELGLKGCGIGPEVLNFLLGEISLAGESEQIVERLRTLAELGGRTGDLHTSLLELAQAHSFDSYTFVFWNGEALHVTGDARSILCLPGAGGDSEVIKSAAKRTPEFLELNAIEQRLMGEGPTQEAMKAVRTRLAAPYVGSNGTWGVLVFNSRIPELNASMPTSEQFEALAECQIIAGVLTRMLQPTKRKEAPSLTSSELEVLTYGVKGFTTHEIAEMIGVTERTVSARFTSLMQKFGCSSRKALVAEAVSQGIARA